MVPPAGPTRPIVDAFLPLTMHSAGTRASILSSYAIGGVFLLAIAIAVAPTLYAPRLPDVSVRVNSLAFLYVCTDMLGRLADVNGVGGETGRHKVGSPGRLAAHCGSVVALRAVPGMRWCIRRVHEVLGTHTVHAVCRKYLCSPLPLLLMPCLVRPPRAPPLLSPASRRYLPAEECDQAYIALDINADLRPLFHTNTKHVYAYVTAAYANSTTHVRNEVVVWDRMISSREAADVKVAKGWVKYSLKDWGVGLRGAPVRLWLRWSLMPRIGGLAYGGIEGEPYTMPVEYTQ